MSFIITDEELCEWEAGGMCWSEEKDSHASIHSRPLSGALRKERERVLAIVDKYCFDTKPEDYDTEYAYPDRFDAGQRYAYEAVRNKLESLRSEQP